MTEVDLLDGPRHEPADGEARQLVILLHGRGADGNDLIGLAPHFASVLPGAAFVAPNAPYSCADSMFGFQWFDSRDPDPAARLAQIRDTAGRVDAYINSELARYGLTDDRLALVGFSQGTMMSLFVGPRREHPCAGIMGYSGRLESPDALAAEIKSRPPVVLVHGDRDELLPIGMLEDAAAGLVACDMEVETHVRPGLGHGIDEEGVQIGRDFLTRVLMS